MSENNKPEAKYEETIWMSGNRTQDGSYFICENRDDLHSFGGGDFGLYCKKHEKRLANKDECNLDCEEYGYCETCRGFSAVGCDVCQIPRSAKK